MIASVRWKTTVIFILAAGFTWLGYHLGADNLMVALTIGGGAGLRIFGSWNQSNGLNLRADRDNGMLFCLLMVIAGLLFTLFGAGIPAALSLLVATVLASVFTDITLNT